MELRILECCHVFVTVDSYFHEFWSWNRLLEIIPNLTNDQAKWYAIETIGEVCRLGEETKQTLLKNISSNDQTALQHSLSNLQKLKVVSKVKAEDIDSENVPSNLSVIENVLLPKSDNVPNNIVFVSLESRKKILTDMASGIASRKTIFLMVSFLRAKISFLNIKLMHIFYKY